jgi:carnosine N-methyltransferase
MDCVVSAFFLETGHNVVKYVEEIRKLLKPNGYWINVGSLSYAYESHENEVCYSIFVFSFGIR